MTHSLFPSITPRDQVQSRLLALAAAFLFLFALVLTLSPAVRLHTWNVRYRWEHWLGFVVWLGGFAFLHRASMRALPERDPYLLPIAALLSGWGLLTIWRLDLVLGLRQSAWLALSLLLLWLGMRTPRLTGLLYRYKYLELTGGLLLTALTFLFGVYPGGAGPRLWLGCCGVYLQPSEPLKLLLIIYLSAYLADRLPLAFNWLALLTPTLVLTGTALVLLVGQRDLGTASLVIFLYSLILYLASGRRQILLASAGSLLVAGGVGYLLFDVIRIRVNAWLNPWADPSGRSYQIVQSLVGVASGGIFGSGPGLGSPGVVPVAHSDFIFAAVAEEMGLLGAAALLALLALLAGRGLRTALCAVNSYQRYLAAGLTAYLCVQGVLIIGGNLRLLPLTGVTLPFFSYGGSSLVTAFTSLLLLMLISSTPETDPAPLPDRRPYLLAGAGILAGLTAAALVSGWWGTVRADALQSRGDNPRRFIADRYVQRGSILDRANRPLQVTNGQPGSFTRASLYPPLSTTIGYTNATYGQGGIEFSQDGYLRGTQGSPASSVWSSFLLYNQPPPGLNVRLTVDLDVQKSADALLGERRGALVLLNAATGEVLALASHPYFDPDQIDGQWDAWRSDPAAPLVNRAAQGQYSPGTALAPFWLAQALRQGAPPALPDNLNHSASGREFGCTAARIPAGATWQWAAGHGCPGALLALAGQMDAAGILNTYQQTGLLDAPTFPLPVAQPQANPALQDRSLALLGEEKIQVTPLQMALAAALVSTGGSLPAPQLVMAVETPAQGWVVLPSGQAATGRLAGANWSATAQMLAVEGAPFWQALGSGLTSQSKVTWYLGGTQPGATQGTPLALAVLLEEDNPAAAEQIGLGVLRAASQP